jgi:hypothetical protein
MVPFVVLGALTLSTGHWSASGLARRFNSCLPDHFEEGRTAPVSEETGALVSKDRAERVKRLIEALTGVR